MSHTPGPWDCDGTEVHAEHLVICTAYRSRTDDEGNWMPNEEVEANARLIAAAPELLAVCQTLLEWQSEGDPYACEDWMEFATDLGAQAFRAIAKAEGRTDD